MALKASTIVARFFLVLLAVFMLLQLAFLGGLWWLHTQQGQGFLQRQISAAMEGSGYALQIEGIGYRPFNAIALKHVALTDDAGATISAKDVTVRTGLAPLMNRTLLLSISMGQLAFSEDASKAKQKTVRAEEPVVPFTLPKLYIKSVVLKSFSIREILSDGGKIAGNVTLKGRTDLDSVVTAKVEAVIPDVATAKMSGRFDPQTLIATVHKLEASGMGLDVNGSGQASLAEKGEVALNLTATIPELSAISGDVQGHGDITAVISGKTSAPDLSADGTIEITREGGRDLAPVKITAKAKDFLNHLSADIRAQGAYQRKPVTVSFLAEQQGASLSFQKLSASLPGIKLSGSGSYDTNASAMTGAIKLALNDLSLYMPDVPPEYRPRGTADISIRQRDISLKGAFRFAGKNLRLGSSALWQPESDTVAIRQLRLTDGSKGYVEAAGTYRYAPQSSADIKLALNSFRLPIEGPLQGVVSGNANLQQKGDRFSLSGLLRPERLDITIPEKFSSTIPTLNVRRPGQRKASTPDFLELIDADIKIHAPKRVFVRGWGLDAEFGGTIAVTGQLGDPQVNGNFSSLRGRFEEFGKRFTIEHASLNFQGSVPPSPYLDIKAVIHTDGIDAAVLLTGSAAKPEIGFSSVPALPKDEVLARILFGRDMSRLSPFEAVQLADTLRRFSGQGSSSSFNPLNAFRNAIGLDDFRVDQDEDGQTTVGAGKYISDKVYIELKKGQGSETGAAAVNIDVTKNIKVESEIGDTKGAGGGISWRWDY